MRRAFIGLSAPIGFDYRNEASKAPADTYSSPNPILDSPFGLLLLFDELVFATRSLCPENMRNLPYVSFLDENGLIPNITSEDIKIVTSNENISKLSRKLGDSEFKEILRNNGILDQMGVDNHSHGLKIGPIEQQANASAYNLAIDRLIYSRIADKSLELIVNSRFHSIESELQATNQNHLAEAFVLENIPNYLTKNGPYHQCIEEVRDNKYISDFRKWISERPRHVSLKEAAEMKEEVEQALRSAQEDIFLRHLEPKRHYETIGKAVLGDILGILCPVSGTIGAMLETTVDAAADKEYYWQGFVVSARKTIRRIK